MRFERLGAALLLAALVTGCGGNSTPISVAVTPSIAQTVIVNGSLQFGATVGGSSTNTVTWEVCLPPLTIKTNAQPQDCQANNLGTITQNGLYTAPAVVPTPATVAIVAFSTVNKMIFGFAPVTIVSGVTVSLNLRPLLCDRTSSYAQPSAHPKSMMCPPVCT